MATATYIIYHAQGRGCLNLLRDGATPLTSIEDLVDYFPRVRQATTDRSELPGGLPDRWLAAGLRRVLPALHRSGLVSRGAVARIGARSASRGEAIRPDFQSADHRIIKLTQGDRQ